MATPAVAAPPFTETTNVHGVTETVVDTITCEEEGALYEITITYNLVAHVTVFDDGRIHETFT